jgi:predicted branched-subunit amino acid permease
MDVRALDGEPVVGVDRCRQAQRAAALAGVRAIAPLVVGLAPLALTVGATAARADLPPLAGWASSALLYGASGQLTWMEVLDRGGPAALAVAATVIVNLQLLLYGAAMRAHWQREPRRRRLVSAQLLVGPVFAVVVRHHANEPAAELRHRFYMAAATTLWTAWLVLTGIGAALGGIASLQVLALLTPLVLLSLALRAVTDAATLVALAVAGSLAVVARTLPFDLGSVGAGVAGVIAGVALDALRRKRRTFGGEPTP